MTAPILTSYPPVEVTNYGITVLNNGVQPQITYTSPDGSMIFYLNGGLAPFPGVTEGVVLVDGVSGLTAPFKHLDHKAARQDGATWVDTVYDPAQIVMKLRATALNRTNLRQILRDWMNAWDPKNPGTLSWTTTDGGQWTAQVRLAAPHQNRLKYHSFPEQDLTWTIRIDGAFWSGPVSQSTFLFQYDYASDIFNRTNTASLGSNWSQAYTLSNAGTCGTNGNAAIWTPSGTAANTVVNRWLGVDAVQTVSVYGSPTSFTLDYNGNLTTPISAPANASAVQSALSALPGIGSGNVSVSGPSGGPYTVTFTGSLSAQAVPALSGSATGGTNSYVTVAQTQVGMPATTATDVQIVQAQLGAFYTWPFPEGAYIDLWARRDTNDANPTGWRMRVGVDQVILSWFNAGVETVMSSQFALILPFPNQTFTFLCGTPTNSREYVLQVDGFPVLQFMETGTSSFMGASYRNAGFGMTAGAGSSGQVVPPTLSNWSMSDNGNVTQSGYLPLTNFGDEVEFPDFLVYGPGTFAFSNGPGGDPVITFGPLADNQTALLRTNPGFRGVYDLSSAPSQQTLNGFQSFIQALLSLAFNNNIPPLVSWFESLFGITPQQGNLYSLLNGRWSQGVPPKPLTGPVTTRYAVQITGGSASSKVIAALTPRRRWPE